MNSELIITNGDSTVGLMQEAGFTAVILPWRDVLHDGPVPDLPPEELAKVRADFLADYGDVPATKIEADFLSRDATLADPSRFETIDLWFEHDLYDQLQLLQILARIFEDFECTGSKYTRSGEGLNSIRLIQADTYLSRHTPDTISGLGRGARPVIREDAAYASAVWSDFTGTNPGALNHRFETASPLPFVPPALRRLAQEFPHRDTGLGLTETRILQILVREPELAGKLFGKVLGLETAQFMGDLSFAARLDSLAFAPTPLIEGLAQPLLGQTETYDTYFTSGLAITRAGRDVLAGGENHCRLNGIDRWIGGTHLTPSNLWVWDGESLMKAPAAS